MTIEIRRSVIISLGEQGYQIAKELGNRLQRRHGGIPIVQRIALLKDPGHAQKDESDSLEILPVSLGQEQVERLKREQPNVLTWLPQVEPLDLNCPAGARLALLDLYNEIGNTLRETINKKLFSPQSETLMSEKGLKIASPGTTPVDVFIIGNLGDPVVSGMFIDLAYLVRKISNEELADNLSFQVNGLFLLPQLTLGWNESAAEETKKLQATAYAALKELDYYMDAHPYHLNYARGEVIEFSANTSPFEPGYCYLVGPTNEGIETIDTQNAINMVAEWFYHILIAPIYSRLAAHFYLNRYGPGQAIGAYSSIGLSSLILPMRYVRDYCARQLVHKLVDSYLLAPSAPNQKDKEDRTRRDFHNSQVPFDTLRTALIGTRNQDDRAYSISPQSYDALSLFEYKVLETTLIKHYNHRQGTILPNIKTRMAVNRERLETEIVKRLQKYTQQLFDDDQVGAIDRSINFFGRLLDGDNGIRQRKKQLERDVQRYETERQQHDQKIKERRGRYFNAAQAFGNLPLIPGLATLVAFLMIFGYTYLVLGDNLGYPLEAGIAIGLGVITVTVVTWSMFSWIGATRASFIQQYNSRLQTHRLLEEARLEIDVLKTIENCAQDLDQEIVAFRDEIFKLRALAEDRWQHGQDWEQLLYGHPYFSLEESVIDKQDVKEYYDEVFGIPDSDKKRHVETLFHDKYEGYYHTWLEQWVKQELDAEEMWSRLYRYCTDQAEVLTRHYIVKKIEEKQRYDKDKVREKIEKITKHARPFLKTRIKGDLGEAGDTPLQKSIAVHFEHDEEQDGAQGSKVAKALYSLRLDQNVDDFGERNRLSVITARRGLPLYILPDVMNCHPAYRDFENLNHVHTTRGNIALPDISEGHLDSIDHDTMFALEPRQAFALAVAFPKFGLATFDTLQHQAAQINSADQGQTEQAGYYQIYTDKRQIEIARRLNREAKSTRRYLGSSKAKACLTLRANPELLSYLRQDITSYLDQVELPELASELYDYIESAKIPDPHNPQDILDDWEMVELDNALDILLPYLRSESESDDQAENEI